jgi:hypothetical protein
MTIDMRLAVIVDPSLSIGVLANTVTAIGIGIGAAAPVLGNTRLTDARGLAITTSANRPVPILQAGADTMRALLLNAVPASADATVVVFPQFARKVHHFDEYLAAFPTRDLSAEKLDGIGLLGPAAWLKSLTGNLKLLR